MELFEQLIDYNLIKKSWRDVYRGKSIDQRKSSKGIDDVSLFKFKQDEDNNLKNLFLDLKSGSYKHLPLFGFPRKKPGKEEYRLITVPAIQDRIVERAMLKVIYPYVKNLISTEVSYCGSRNPNGTKRNMRQAFEFLISEIKKSKFIVFESDIKSFFDEIDKDLLYSTLKQVLPDHSLDELIKDIIYFEIENLEKITKSGKKFKIPSNKAGISQGSPLSPIFANIYLNKFDKTLFDEFGNGLIRYVDDFIFICNNKTEGEKFYKRALEILDSLKLTMPPLDESISNSKTKLTDLKDPEQFFTFLGIKASKFGLVPNIKETFGLPERKNRTSKGLVEFRAKFVNHYLNPNHEDYKKLDNSNKLIRMQSKINGFYDYYKIFHSDKVLLELNKYIAISRRLKPFENLQLITVPTTNKIISIEDWQDLFKA